MTAPDERYRRAQALAHELLDLPASERDARLAAICGDDAELRRETQWLIDSAESDDDLAPPPFAPATSLREQFTSARIDAHAPRHYALIERIGEGGTGAVWLAEREVGGVRQRVALKLLRGATPSAGELSRFVAEGRILAALSHPNIAHLVDAGSGTDGMPFLAMEYVDGERLDRWCDAHALALRARIELFLKICAAVEYAHGRLVIHRDLKPANILVNRDGEPKLLDFGIARLLDAEIGGNATTVINAMTMAYASPEQVEGKPLGTATDIWSLGVVLYELVAGVRPFDHLRSEHERSNAIVSGQITPPSRSTRTPPARTDTTGALATPSRRIPADVDAIVLKALRREPAQRYASVAALADDLRHYLDARPVAARRGQWSYRALRFAWRNRWALAAATVLLALGAAFLVERERQLHRIELERDRASAIARFTGDLFDSAGSLRTRGNAVSVREMLDRGAADLQKRSDLPDDLKSSLLLTMGRAYNSLSLGKESLPLLQAAQALLAPGTPEQRADVVEAIGVSQDLQGLSSEAIANYDSTIALLRALPDDKTDRIDNLRVRIAAIHIDTVEVPIEQTTRELEGIVAALDKAPQRSDDLRLNAYNTLSQAYIIANDTARALPFVERAAALSTRLYGVDDARTSRARKNLALALMDSDPARAATMFGELLADYDRFSGTPSITRAGSQYNFAKSLRYAGRLPEAAANLEQALALVREQGGAQHRLTLVILDELGVAYNLAGEPAKTRDLLGKALPDFAEAARKGSDGEQDCYAMALATLGEAERLDKQYDDAATHFAQADAILAKLDINGFRDDVLDLLEWSAALQLDRRDAAAARATLDRHDELAAHPSPSARRVATSQVLRTRLDGLSTTSESTHEP